MAEERLQKILARAGVASRRASEQYILDGRVSVNGKVVRELGIKADSTKDRIEVEGHGVLHAQPLVYIAMYKPPNVMTTLNDPEGRTTILDILLDTRAKGKRHFEGELPRVFPVGRLDFDAEGILILTNDGALSNQLIHPRFHVPKTYSVKVKGRPEEKDLERLRQGVRLREADGRPSRRSTKPAEVQILKQNPKNTWLDMTIFEGRHHQVKRMCEAIGAFVNRLVRTDFGGIGLDELPVGGWRFLTGAEVESLRNWKKGKK
ncbi:rRNA pseudouridine synthase [Myxococcota bacterium]|nr:rRNA pseudouridine synthase [Myxococcota bacterium]